SPAGGPITVCIELTASEVAIRVADKGMGIPAGALPQLFTRFYRAANANPRQISGLGIGLYVVKEIVARHRGRVEVASEEGQGSTFSIYLPYTPGNGILPLTQQQLHETEVG
ncbi:MAG: ATP-binding protein, partial [Chloroflexaceae bacterium]|nr:ATP-binding protein [Chloroflexaceae bacterium]